MKTLKSMIDESHIVHLVEESLGGPLVVVSRYTPDRVFSEIKRLARQQENPVEVTRFECQYVEGGELIEYTVPEVVVR